MLIFTSPDIADPPVGSEVILPCTGQTIDRRWSAVWWTRGDRPEQVIKVIKKVYPGNKVIIVGDSEWSEACGNSGVAFIHRDLWEERQTLQICPVCYQPQSRCQCGGTE
jgi:hypothetical protein